ncbi:ABC-type transport system, involved in lipoprotein release, permease component [Algoriphagus locisalis]|uniref:ABC-type transport system, involved in lipoprotein release, permease component n=1 Tax=Algoriphagus locisalis TaxID=305507 RepID=A0A1I7BMD8_9BACT|nr:ABC transporter permease [Algoriphagus locisalis]SFT88329.1 ABC-type transport system, involved in lipoprotein release, permease component [Algoriphagus locisalis]
MLKNYFKIAWRNIVRSKGYAFINIGGLGIGMASAILILLWIQNEVSMDREHSKSDRIYRMYNRDTFSGELWAWGTTPKIMGPTLEKDYPEVEQAVRINHANFLFTVGDKKMNESGSFIDPDFLDVFDFPMLQGNSSTALEDPYNMVVTEDFAKKLFGTEMAVGQTVKIDSTDIFTVTGVLENLPNNTRFQSDYFLSWAYMKKLGWDDEWWGNNSVENYVLLTENASHEAFNEKVINITKEHTNGENTADVFSYPLSQIHLYGKSENGQLVGGRIVTVRMFGFIALFILVIACINFMNLSTARSEKRAKEVGLRKVVGARKTSLIAQFIGESTLIALIAGVLAILLVELALPSFNILIGKQLFLPYTEVIFWLQLISFILLTGLLAGSYPAFFLSSFSPVNVLKGTFRSAASAVNPRKILVVIQFSFAIILIVSTIIIQRQISHAQNRELGYNQDNLIYISMQGDIEKHYSAIKQALLSSGSSLAVTQSMSPITQRYSDGWGYSWEGSTPEDEKLDFIRFSADADFMKVMGTNLVEGRDIDIYEFASDSTAILLNETAIRKMGLENPLGQIVSDGEDNYTVVGIIEDFIFESPYDPVNPLMVFGPSSWFSYLHIRLNPDQPVADNLAKIQSVFEEFNPNFPFEYQFADEQYARKFDDTARTAKLSIVFTILTIVISCLGLFGLSTYMAANRLKEIGVRKVLGASVGSISLLLSKDFLKLVGIAFLLSVPIAWYIMDQWLQNYDYSVGIEWWVFVATGTATMLIALFTVGFQSIKAALTNPARTLKSE